MLRPCLVDRLAHDAELLRLLHHVAIVSVAIRECEARDDGEAEDECGPPAPTSSGEDQLTYFVGRPESLEGAPFWTPIEPCASRQSRSFGSAS